MPAPHTGRVPAVGRTRRSPASGRHRLSPRTFRARGCPAWSAGGPMLPRPEHQSSQQDTGRHRCAREQSTARVPWFTKCPFCSSWAPHGAVDRNTQPWAWRRAAEVRRRAARQGSLCPVRSHEGCARGADASSSAARVGGPRPRARVAGASSGGTPPAAGAQASPVKREVRLSADERGKPRADSRPQERQPRPRPGENTRTAFRSGGDPRQHDGESGAAQMKTGSTASGGRWSGPLTMPGHGGTTAPAFEHQDRCSL